MNLKIVNFTPLKKTMMTVFFTRIAMKLSTVKLVLVEQNIALEDTMAIINIS